MLDASERMEVREAADARAEETLRLIDRHDYIHAIDLRGTGHRVVSWAYGDTEETLEGMIAAHGKSAVCLDGVEAIRVELVALRKEREALEKCINRLSDAIQTLREAL
jgi:hypothetical protein